MGSAWSGGEQEVLKEGESGSGVGEDGTRQDSSQRMGQRKLCVSDGDEECVVGVKGTKNAWWD